MLQMLIRSAKLAANKNYITHTKTIVAMSGISNSHLSHAVVEVVFSIFTGLHFFLDPLYWKNRPTSFSPQVCLVPDFSFGVDAPSNRTDKRMLWRWSTARRTCGSLSLLILPVCWVHQDMRWTKHPFAWVNSTRVFRMHAVCNDWIKNRLYSRCIMSCEN